MTHAFYPLIASALIADMQVSNLWPGQIVTEIRPAQLMTQIADQFWAAVLYHAYTGNFPPTRRMVRKAVEWDSQLTPEQYYINRQKGTESAFSYQSTPKSCSLFEPGTYGCVCCNTPLFTTQTQYESHSGWPSFTQSLPSRVIAYHADDSHGMERIEVTCNVCDAHLGHVFPDGPQPIGLRYCINSVALTRMVILS